MGDGSSRQMEPWLRRRAWTGAILGVVAAALFVSTLAGAFVHTGVGWLFDGLAGLLLGAAAVALFACVTWLLAAVVKRAPRSFLYALGGTTGTLLALRYSRYIGFRFPDPYYFPVLVLFIGAQAAIGATLAIALRDKFKELAGGIRNTVVAVFLIALFVDVGIVFWLAHPGSDPYPVENPSSAIGKATSLDAPDPGRPGDYEVATLFYGSGNNNRRPEFGNDVDIKTETVDASRLLPEWKGFSARVREWYWGYGIKETPLNGRVWYPEGDGPFPLALIVHGNHGMTDYSDPGYAYLGELLAGRGFILVSVDENLINGSWAGDFRGKEMPLRGWLLLEHLRLWREWNGTRGHVFHGKVDMENIALIGHSRGGEAVSIAGAFNRLPFFPDDARVRFDYNFAIKSLVSIAQTDQRYERRLELENINFLALIGSYDSDEPSFHGMRQYARIRFTDENYWFKTGITVHRANHGQFNTSWGRKDSGPPGSWLLNLEPLIPGEDQRRVAEIYISAFLEATLRGKRDYIPLFRDHKLITDWLPEGSYISRFQDSTFRAVADYEEDLDVTTASMPGGLIESNNLAVWREVDLPFRDKSTQRNNAVYLGWRSDESAGEDGGASYTIRLPEDFTTETGLGPETRLVFSLAHADEKPKAPGSDDKENEEDKEGPGTKNETIDLTLELEDANGSIVSAALSRFAPITQPLRVQFMKQRRLNRERYGNAWEPTLQTYEVPLQDFTEIDPVLLRVVRFRFDRNPSGVIILDEVGFRSNP